jgi:aminomethyltransferase
MKATALEKIHQTLGAKMASFAGYNMPIQYEGINIEHESVRKSVGVFDVSHMGEFLITGKQALDLIQKVTSNDASLLKIGDIQYSCMTNGGGGIVDDLLVYRIDENSYMLVVNASNIEKDWNWIKFKNNLNCEMINMSDDLSLLAVQGPKAIDTLQKLTAIDLKSIPYYHFKTGELAGIKEVIISATGYTGAGGFEIYFQNHAAETIWNKIFEAGKEYGIKPIGLGARDTLRLEMGYCLYGNDINDSTSPIEAGLGWITKFTKEFTSSMQLLRQKNHGVSKRLVGFEMVDKGIPRHDYEIVDASGNLIGLVTSGTQSPTLKKAIGMGYIKTEFSIPGTEIFIKIRDNKIKASVQKLPFANPTVK